VGQHGQGLSFPVFAFELGKEFFAFRISSEEEAGGFGEGPFEMGVSDLFPGGSVFFPCGFLDGLDQSAIGGELLDASKSGDIVDLIEDDEGQDFPDTRNGPQTIVGIDIVFFGVF